ncbi:MAG: Flp pilus assembly complex ATPase component TadA [Blastocatellia bacterium]|nr:Flp pilus assembly complex ATPase component TadA [Blastocatellia bacterium]
MPATETDLTDLIKREEAAIFKTSTGEIFKRIGDLLIEAGMLSRSECEDASHQAQQNHRRIGETLVEMELITERTLYRYLALQRGVQFAEEEELVAKADPSITGVVAPKFLERHKILPILREGKRILVASSQLEPTVPELAQVFNAEEVAYCLVTPTDFRRLQMAFDLSRPGAGVKTPTSSTNRGARDLLKTSEHQEALGITLFQAILLEAIAHRASDIHLERYGERVRLRLRVDGDLHDISKIAITPEQYLVIINIIKIQANMDIAEHRLPQGGRFSVLAGGHSYDLRVQTQPSLHGEHVVVRLLSKEVKLLSIEQLGFPQRLANIYRRLLQSPSGLLLIVGATGSGKTTSLYAGLNILALDATRKVITIEDPIEYGIDNIQQTQVRPEIGFSFADAMRSFVRQDPDSILVGEIRDPETALEAIRASQTGHLVLSTLHCNDCVDAVQRLFDLHVHPNSVASELLGVFAQRLAKRICPYCRQPIEMKPDIAKEIFPRGVPPGFQCFEGKGCPQCDGFGSFGRIAIVEFLPTNREIRKAISLQPPLDELRGIAFQEGWVPMREHALELVQEGYIALDELPALFQPEQLRPYEMPV